MMIPLRFLMLLQVNLAFEEPTAAAENRVVADVAQMISQVIDTVQSAVAIPAGKGRYHPAGERVAKAGDA